jgi:hypothetical protein
MRTLGWGLFLASSWTWCIGMFLPVIMLRDYGWLGFLVFALPNVAGCTLFGWRMPPDRSARLLARCGWLAALFSVVTIAYHLFFVGFASRALVEASWRLDAVSSLGLAVSLLIAAGALSFLPRAAWPWLGALAWIASIGCWIGWATAAPAGAPHEGTSGGALEGLLAWSWTGSRPATDLLSLGWPLLFGFLWSPWFDLSFHRARRESGSPLAFLVFGAAFGSMLLFTAAYAADAGSFGLFVILHLALQSLFTVAVHLRELREAAPAAASSPPAASSPAVAPSPTRPAPSSPDLPRRTWLHSSLLTPSVLLWAVAALLGASAPDESNYLRFLVFYGLVVPVLGMALLTPPSPESDRRVLPLALLLVVSALLLEAAFIRGHPLLACIPYALLVPAALWMPGRGVPARPLEPLRRLFTGAFGPLRRYPAS